MSKEEIEEDSELEDLLDEEALEELAKEIEEESGIIEEDIPNEFIPTNSRASPVLERVAGEQEVGWVRREGAIREEDEGSGGIKYNGSLKYGGDDDKKYETQIDTSGDIRVFQPEHIDISSVGRESELRTLKDFTTGFSGEKPKKEEYFKNPENVDTRNLGREDPLKKKQREYFV